MKIYFEDGELLNRTDLQITYDVSIDAKYGYSLCESRLDTLLALPSDIVVYTNSTAALDGKYVWNNEYSVHELFLRDKNGVFQRVDKLTDRELRQGHNIRNLYVSGAFNS